MALVSLYHIPLYFQAVGSAEKYPRMMQFGILAVDGGDILSPQTEAPFSYLCGAARCCLHSAGEKNSCLSAGQAERLACHWQPTHFAGWRPHPLFAAKGRRAERRNAHSPNAGITMPLTKRTPSPGMQRKQPLFGPVSRCVGRMGAGWHPCQPKQVCCHCRRCVAEVGDDCWNTFPPELRVNLPVESIAGENPGAFIAPGRSLPPAVRAVSGDGG